MTLALTDIDVAVDAAFKDLECCSRQKTPHAGEVFAWLEQHDCYSGFICHAHYKRLVEQVARLNRRVAEVNAGEVLCAYCKKWYPLEQYAKVVVL